MQQGDDRIILVDSTSTTLTVSWPEIVGASHYVLQYCKATSDGGGEGEEEYETLSAKLTTTQARKKNLVDKSGFGFFFRVGVVPGGANAVSTWSTHSQPFRLLSEADEQSRMSSPKVSLSGTNNALLVSWSSDDSSDGGYELQMRENAAGSQWITIASSLSGTEARKKNLTSKHGYQFRVRPSGVVDRAFSAPSDPVVALGLSDGISRLFGSLEAGTLLKSMKAPIPLADALGGKEFVLLYASANWCGPCRQFTPMLSKWYQSMGPTKSVEVVFLSADHDQSGFDGYYSHMPWLAVPYDDDTRDQLMGHIRVSGIPRLAVLDGRTGRIVEDNAVGQQLDINRWRRLAAGNK